MRVADIQQDTLFSTVIPEQRVPADHPLRPIRVMVNTALKDLDEEFSALYSELGRDSIAPEKLLRAQLLMAFYTIRSERQLMEQINYTTCCFAGSWVFRRMTRYGITRALPRTGIDCWRVR